MQSARLLIVRRTLDRAQLNLLTPAKNPRPMSREAFEFQGAFIACTLLKKICYTVPTSGSATRKGIVMLIPVDPIHDFTEDP